MIFTLIKNELIKITRRGKTWVVFGLFALAMVGFIFMAKISANQMAHWQSPEGQIENIDTQLGWSKDNLKHNEDYLNEVKNNKSSSKEEIENAKSNVEYAKNDIERLQADRKIQEKLIGQEAPDWRIAVKSEIASLKSELERAKVEGHVNKEQTDNINKQIERNQYFLDNDIKPIQEWEFYPSNFGIQVMMMLGMVILVAGIAVFMSDIISGECTPATLKFLLVQPISRGKVVLSKFIAIIITVVSMICGLEIATFGIMGAFTGFDAMKMPVELALKYQINQEVLIQQGFKQLDLVANSGYNSTMGEFVLKSFLLQVLFIIACCAFIFMISALFKSSMITMAVSVIVSVAATMLPMMSQKIGEYAHLIFLNYGNTPAVIQGNIAYNYSNVNFTPQLGAILMIGTIIVSYIVAHVVFSKRDMLV
ncbi:ABC transporter permease subunit [Clostridium sardiniense]|uniref:ABC transporter permease subunit n=1 Tax=Clostridium sardiniense TaxID=29369 RepID=A0ABS7L222_CLOSR|nr:ABC transporter permease subunit [Clostridium sardiniense]MBY0757138.1 ABC transporter permease subunit [Clostridium sardiniense]MDQ0461404.1 ABC-2 type transport system permease protein [Clostridium sardiniense]